MGLFERERRPAIAWLGSRTVALPRRAGTAILTGQVFRSTRLTIVREVSVTKSGPAAPHLRLCSAQPTVAKAERSFTFDQSFAVIPVLRRQLRTGVQNP